MRSDFLLVRYPGDAQWQSFRDVAEVDGKPVRDKEERLTKLFLEPASSAVRRARELQEAGTRYNLLDIGTLNNPLMVIAFLQDRLPRAVPVQSCRPRQEARTHGQDRCSSRNSKCRRSSRATAIRTSCRAAWCGSKKTPDASSRPSCGSVAARRRSPIITAYKFDEELGINVPVEMRDWYPDGTGEIRGVATYGRFRRFQVKTEEAVK